VKAIIASEGSGKPAIESYQGFMQGMLRKIRVSAKKQAKRYASTASLEASLAPGSMLMSGLLMMTANLANTLLPPEKIITLPL